MATKRLEVDIVSTETVKPSSPTPQHLLTHHLSWIDQIVPPIHICVVLFYSGSGGVGSTPDKLRRLKRSLSEALALYYPLAGRLDGTSSSVTCTDEGVDFIVARASCPLSTVFRDPETETVDRLLPCNRRCTAAGDGWPLLTVQATAFDCGGVAVGLCLYHKVADGHSLAVFLKTWAAVARGEPDAASRRPCLDMAVLFPPVKGPPASTNAAPAEPKRLVIRRFVLDGSSICDLREKGGSAEDGAPLLTRVQAVTALLWRCLIRVACNRDGAAATSGEFAASHAVNLRPRMHPPLPDSAFGNVVAPSTTPVLFVPATPGEHSPDAKPGHLINSGTDNINRRSTEEHTSAAIRKVDGGYIRETLQGPPAYYGPLLEYLARGVTVVWFSSMWGFPFYEADFGWGRPAWVARAGSDVVQTEGVTLMGRREGGGHMEAWVTLGPEEMGRVERDPELVSLLSPLPYPPFP